MKEYTYLKLQFFQIVSKHFFDTTDNDVYMSNKYMEILLEKGMITQEEYDMFYNEIGFKYNIDDMFLTDNDFIEKNYSENLKKIFKKVLDTKPLALEIYTN